MGNKLVCINKVKVKNKLKINSDVVNNLMSAINIPNVMSANTSNISLNKDTDVISLDRSFKEESINYDFEEGSKNSNVDSSQKSDSESVFIQNELAKFESSDCYDEVSNNDEKSDDEKSDKTKNDDNKSKREDENIKEKEGDSNLSVPVGINLKIPLQSKVYNKSNGSNRLNNKKTVKNKYKANTGGENLSSDYYSKQPVENVKFKLFKNQDINEIRKRGTPFVDDVFKANISACISSPHSEFGKTICQNFQANDMQTLNTRLLWKKTQVFFKFFEP